MILMQDFCNSRSDFHMERFPIHGSHVQNYWVAPRSTQPFILLRSIKWVPEISGTWWLCSLQAYNPIHKIASESFFKVFKKFFYRLLSFHANKIKCNCNLKMDYQGKKTRYFLYISGLLSPQKSKLSKFRFHLIFIIVGPVHVFCLFTISITIV